MKIIFRCDPGCEDAVKEEAKKNSLNTISEGSEYVIVESKDYFLIAEAIIHSQTILEAAIFLENIGLLNNLKIDEDVFEKFNRSDKNDPINKIFSSFESFAVKSDDQEINEEIGTKIKEITKKKVNLTNPDILFTAQESNDGILLGISLTKLDLKKRPFKIFVNNKSLRSTINASILIMAGYDGKKNLLVIDSDGSIAIEAALMAMKKSPYYYQPDYALFNYWPETKKVLENINKKEKLIGKIDVAVSTVPFLKATQKNAKIAGVNKNLNITRSELDWLDTKYEKSSKDIIITYLRASGKHKSITDALKEANELAYQAKYLLKKEGVLAIASIKPEEPIKTIEKNGFKLMKEHNMFMGEQPVTLLLFKIAV